MTLGQKIKKIRVELNYDQEGFGRHIGVIGKTVSAYECDRCVPGFKVLAKIKEAYGVCLICGLEHE